MSGAKIIEGLKQAVAGDLHRVTIDGQRWVREDDLKADLQAIMGINNRLRETLLEVRQFVNDKPLTDEEASRMLAQINNAVR